MTRLPPLLAAPAAAALLLSSAGNAQEPAKDRWQFKIAPILWMAGIDGDIRTGDLEADVSEDFGDIIENVDFGLEAQIEATKGDWTIAFRPNYIASSVDSNIGPISADIDSDTLLLEVAGLYRLGTWPWRAGTDGVTVEALAGIRYTDLSTDVDLDPGPTISSDQNWVDPIIGTRITIDLTSRFSLGLRGDIGGFGVGTDFAWNVQALLGYDFNDWITGAIGYRALDQDYDDDDFAYDVLTHGPMLGVQFRF